MVPLCGCLTEHAHFFAGMLSLQVVSDGRIPRNFSRHLINLLNHLLLTTVLLTTSLNSFTTLLWIRLRWTESRYDLIKEVHMFKKYNHAGMKTEGCGENRSVTLLWNIKHEKVEGKSN